MGKDSNATELAGETRADTIPAVNRPAQVLLASLVGTAIEFFDFYIYATAAVLVFPRLFFPGSDPASAILASLATFAIAFLARPVGSAFFGHFGDRVGRKKTLVAALLTMGLSTVAIGALPTYDSIGIVAPVLLALCRFGQGLGLGGEWGGAVLLAVENAPPGKRAWYGMFPQLGAPVGFLLSGGIFLLLSKSLTNDQFFAFGWRIPFLSSAVLVLVGLYVRITITETPVFREALRRNETARVPLWVVFREHPGTLLMGTMMALATFVLFYLMTVFALSWGTTALGNSREQFLIMQLIGPGVFRPYDSARRLVGGTRPPPDADLGYVGNRRLWPAHGADVCLRNDGNHGDVDGGPVADGLDVWASGNGSLELFPTEVRYTGSSLTFNFAGILGASLAPYFATTLAQSRGLQYVGYYLTAMAGVTLIGLFASRETRDERL